MSDTTPRVALVTGASRGIGQAIALALADRGVDVAVAARQLGPAEDVAAAIQAKGRRALAVSLDVADHEAVDAAVTRIGTELGKIGILVNNAGITKDQLLLRMKPEDWSEVFKVNLDGAFYCTRACVKDMVRARWGRIVNISSVVGTMGNAGQVNYAATKAGLHGFTKSVARELASRNITANVVAPGFIETAMTQELSEANRQAMLQSIPLGRFGAPEDIASTVAFLCGDEAAYITGQVIHVDGGMVMS